MKMYTSNSSSNTAAGATDVYILYILESFKSHTNRELDFRIRRNSVHKVLWNRIHIHPSALSFQLRNDIITYRNVSKFEMHLTVV
jgi:hypothetical protein